MRGINWMPKMKASPKIGALWPWVSACTVSGWMSLWF